METIDIVIPCKNEETNIYNIYNELKKQESRLRSEYDVDFNIIFVDDGSTDNTIKIIKSLSVENKNVKYIFFSKNFGKESAIFAGLKKSNKEFTILMDCDMQDPPELIIDMYKAVKLNNYDACGTRRVSRDGEPKIRSFFSNMFYYFFNLMTNLNLPNGARDFCIMTKKFKDAIIENSERNRFFKGLFCSVGFNIKWIEFKNVKRFAGETKWSFYKLFLYSIDGLTSFSSAPIFISSIIGVMCCLISFMFLIFIIIRAMLFGDRVIGWPSLVAIILFFNGLQFLFIGIIGIYISKNYVELKNRPLYFIKEEL